MAEMSGRTILITGCSSGIGLAAARTLKARGWRVLATARKEEDLARLQDEEGVEALPLELADPASIAACAEEALRRTGGELYALFNNAGFGQVGAVEDVSADLLRRQLEINVIGVHELTRRLLRLQVRTRSFAEWRIGRRLRCADPKRPRRLVGALGGCTQPYLRS
jgi:NAD(P)-dependent dehydrogenase (short-subunit alcohol dehydrogenase family)